MVGISSGGSAGYVTRSMPQQHSGQSSVVPVTPVKAVTPVTRDRVNTVEYTIPRQQGVDAQAEAVRSRIVPYQEEGQLKAELAQAQGNLAEAEEAAVQEKQQEVEGENRVASGECECCKNRKYVDGSDDGSVSYQTPTHISPESSASKVMAHEQEHVRNEKIYAKNEGKEVLNQNVQIYTSVCPECGTSYTSGGLTTTTTKEVVESTGVAKKPDNKISLSDESVDNLMGVVAS